MYCPSCNGATRVLETRNASAGNAVRRRRECLACGTRFTTSERPVRRPALVQKRDGELEPFDPEKLSRALVAAAHKRPVSRSQIDRIVDQVEARAGADGEKLTSAQITELVLAELLDLDYGAYLQFVGTTPGVNPEIAAIPAVRSVRIEEEGS
jgi:transcriptional repressor NrdR